MPRVSDQFRAARRQAVLDAASECFLAHGYRGASMHQIIAATGLSAGALYHHFPGGKAELVSECVRTGLDGVLEAISPVDPRTEQPQEGFQPDAWLVGALEQLAASPRLARLLLITWAEACRAIWAISSSTTASAMLASVLPARMVSTEILRASCDSSRRSTRFCIPPLAA